MVSNPKHSMVLIGGCLSYQGVFKRIYERLLEDHVIHPDQVMLYSFFDVIICRTA